MACLPDWVAEGGCWALSLRFLQKQFILATKSSLLPQPESFQIQVYIKGRQTLSYLHSLHWFRDEPELFSEANCLLPESMYETRARMAVLNLEQLILCNSQALLYSGICKRKIFPLSEFVCLNFSATHSSSWSF